MWTKPLMWVGAASSKTCAEGKGEAKKQKAARGPHFRKHHPRFSSGLFLWAFFKMLALYSRRMTLLTD